MVACHYFLPSPNGTAPLFPIVPLVWLAQLVVASPPKPNSEAEKLGVKKGDVISSINGLDAAKMDSFQVTDYLAMYQVCRRISVGTMRDAAMRFKTRWEGGAGSVEGHKRALRVSVQMGLCVRLVVQRLVPGQAASARAGKSARPVCCKHELEALVLHSFGAFWQGYGSM